MINKSYRVIYKCKNVRQKMSFGLSLSMLIIFEIDYTYYYNQG